MAGPPPLHTRHANACGVTKPQARRYASGRRHCSTRPETAATPPGPLLHAGGETAVVPSEGGQVRPEAYRTDVPLRYMGAKPPYPLKNNGDPQQPPCGGARRAVGQGMGLQAPCSEAVRLLAPRARVVVAVALRRRGLGHKTRVLSDLSRFSGFLGLCHVLGLLGVFCGPFGRFLGLYGLQLAL